MRTLLILAFLAVGPLIAADRPDGKSGKRIDKIEKDFGVTFIQTAEFAAAGKKSPCWIFGHPRGDNSPVYAFATPVNPTDAQIVSCMISSDATARCYLDLIKKLMPQPRPTPANLL